MIDCFATGSSCVCLFLFLFAVPSIPATFNGEVICQEGYVMCGDRKTCVAVYSWCDGTVDCPDADDEMPACVTEVQLRSPRDHGRNRVGKTTTPAPVVCPKHQQLCNDSRTCISQQAWCDHHPDCPNGDDESNNCPPKVLTFKDLEDYILPCNKRVKWSKNYLSDNTVDDLPRPVTSLVAPRDHFNCTEPDGSECDEDYEPIETQFPCGFVEIPKRCKCKIDDDGPLNLICATAVSGKLLNLTGTRPSPITLTMRSDNLTCLGPNGRKEGVYSFFKNLIAMNFSDNGLTCLFPLAFRLHNLVTLDLSSNKLSGLKNRTFESLNVCTLFMENNSLVDWYSDVFHKDSPILWLGLNKNNLTLERAGMFQNLPHTVVIELKENDIRTIRSETFRGLSELRTLDLSMNNIEEIETGAFSGAEKLRTLKLSRNNITTLPEDMLRNSSGLQDLELGYNPIRSIPVNLFRNFNCTNLDLRGIIIDNINEEMFRSLPATCVVSFEKLYYCFSAPHIRNCTPKSDGISSFENLLVSPLLVSLAWILCLFIIVCNLAVFTVRWILDRYLKTDIHDMVVRDARVMSLFIKHLSLSDVLTGVYLLGICYHNEYFKGRYSKCAVDWVHSEMCKALGIIAMSSAEISMMILTFIAVDRFITIVFGLHEPKCSIAVVRVILIMIWLLGLTIAILPAFLWGDRIHDYYGNNGVCLPLYLQEPYLDGWIYSLVVLIGLNGLMILLIITSYAGIFLSIRRWRQTEMPIRTDERQERELLWRFFVLVLVNLSCWIPTFVFKILALTSYKVPDDSYAWIVTFVFPLNCAMNPIVYSLSSSEFRSRVCHATGCHRVYIVFLRRLHVLHRRLSAPFISDNDYPPTVEINPPTDLNLDQAEAADRSASPSICSRLREKCRSAVTPRGSLDARLSPRSSRRTASDLRLDVSKSHEVIPLNGLNSELEQVD